MAPIGRGAYDFVSCSARVTGESSSNSTVSYRHLNVGEGQVVVDHFFKEVRNSELVLPGSNFLSNVLNNGQEFSSISRLPFGMPYAQFGMTLIDKLFANSRK